MNYKPQGCIGQTISWKLPAGVLGDYFDGTGLGIHQLTKGWAIANGSNGTDDFGGNVMVGYKDGDADFGIVGDIGGAKTHTLTQSELPNYNLTRGVGTETVSAGGTSIWSNQSGTDHTETINSGGSGSAHNNLQPYKVALFIQRIA
jgi:microcystin-dependent protein